MLSIIDWFFFLNKIGYVWVEGMMLDEKRSAGCHGNRPSKNYTMKMCLENLDRKYITLNIVCTMVMTVFYHMTVDGL